MTWKSHLSNPFLKNPNSTLVSWVRHQTAALSCTERWLNTTTCSKRAWLSRQEALAHYRILTFGLTQSLFSLSQVVGLLTIPGEEKLEKTSGQLPSNHLKQQSRRDLNRKVAEQPSSSYSFSSTQQEAGSTPPTGGSTALPSVTPSQIPLKAIFSELHQLAPQPMRFLWATVFTVSCSQATFKKPIVTLPEEIWEHTNRREERPLWVSIEGKGRV